MFYLDDKPVDKIPEEVIQKMSKRVSNIVSKWFSEHPDEYVIFLRSLDLITKEQGAAYLAQIYADLKDDEAV